MTLGRQAIAATLGCSIATLGVIAVFVGAFTLQPWLIALGLFMTIAPAFPASVDPRPAKQPKPRDDERRIETLKWLYVDGGIDQPEFERRVAAALRGGTDIQPRPRIDWHKPYDPPRPESDTLCLTSK